MDFNETITILGGGVAGLATATALAQRGASVRVLEQAEAITEVGAGLQISPNGGRVLRALGIDRVGDTSSGVHLRDGLTGRSVLRMALPQSGPGFQLVHRADLIAALETAARAAGVQIALNAQVTGVDADAADHARLIYADTPGEDVPFLIGADGLRAPSRTAVLGDIEPFFTGQVAWRALVPAVGGHPAEAQVHMGSGRHLVSYPLRGGTLINIVAVEERRAWADEGWSHRDDPGTLRRAFSGFGPDVRALLDRVEEVYVWGLFRHGVAPQWSRGRVCLVGDAAHPTLPFMAQGAVMALEDAWVLADSLARAPDAATAFAAYQARRLPRASRAIAAANANARNYHLSGLQARVAHTGLRALNATAPQIMLRRFAWLYDADVTKGSP